MSTLKFSRFGKTLLVSTVLIAFGIILFGFKAWPRTSVAHDFLRSATRNLTATLDTIEYEIASAADDLQVALTGEACHSSATGESRVSWYTSNERDVDKAAQSCFLAANIQLNRRWATLLSKLSTISWAYTYNSSADAMVIFPDRNLTLDYGNGADIRKFSFFQRAVENYPALAWTDVKEDASGTGKILIATRALRPAGWKSEAISISVDLNLERYLRSLEMAFLEASRAPQGGKAFAYLYQSAADRQISVGVLKSENSFWYSLMPRDGRLLNVDGQELEGLNALVERSQDSAPLSQPLMLQGESWQCAVQSVSRVQLVFLFCSE